MNLRSRTSKAGGCWLTACLIWLALCLPSAAQQWQVELTDDTVYRSAVVSYPGLGVSLRCHARSAGGGQVINSSWFESTIPPSDQFLLEFSQHLIPIGVDYRSDIVMFADQTGYRLPPVRWNELAGGIETEVTATDALFTALAGARRWVLQVGTTQAWELPLTGLSTAVEQARAYCATPVAPAAAPGQTASPFNLPPQVQAYVATLCNGPGQILPDGVQAGDLDGDGTPDVVLDWGGVRCPGEIRSGFCGAANCQIDLFLSLRGYAMSHSVLAVGAEIVTHRSGRLGLRMGGTARVCNSIDCAVPWLWNGVDLVQVP